jgi:hypothetical protein
MPTPLSFEHAEMKKHLFKRTGQAQLVKVSKERKRDLG